MKDQNAIAIEMFQYPSSDLPVPVRWADVPEVGVPAHATNLQNIKIALANVGISEKDAQGTSGETPQRSFEAGKEQGIREGRESERLAQEARLQKVEKRRTEQVARLANQFERERDNFLASAEHEVVKLALAIAERILRREAQVDPLFLIGAVRVALGQLADTTTAKLRVPAADAELWSETVAHLPNLRTKPQIVAEEDMNPEECILETELGSVDLSSSSQLAEISRAFFREVQPFIPEMDPSAGVTTR